ncbi:extracellular solute-binding protein [Paenibacillus sp. FSL R5-0912]|uniref:ABC transporter substrate-binding protein n=1 Tax=Paenibacillus sp. FSL R5-0912 TaxID=1536771 RepID=UPI0004F5877E|nr:extracellular solute-binding protein [Paenibacillus sp. FSL R5-0912]AIQ40848.1 ABC transporter substrate-binding protein [Paenibacillus sp. FSL R5-0912]
MRTKKVMSVLISMLLVAATTACGGGSGNGGNAGGGASAKPAASANTPAAEATPEASATAEPTTATPEMDFDMGGRTIKIVSWWDMTIPEDNPDNIQRSKNLKELQKKHNFKVEYVALDFGEYQKKVVASLVAGEPLGDIVRMGKAYMIPALTKQDLFWPVDDYTKNENAFNQQMTTEFSQYNGKGYGFSENAGNLISGVFYNRTLMKKLGMKPLQEYVNEDNWNWDTFTQVAKEANKDTDNNGKLDVWGLASGGFLEMALAANETDLTIDDKQNLDDPKALEVFKFISKLGAEKVARPTEGGDWQEPAQFFRQGNTLMYAGADYEANGFKTDMKDYDIGFVPFPKGPNATEYHSVESNVQFLTIPKKVENPEWLLYIWEKINDIESIYDYPKQASLESTYDNEDDINNAKLVEGGMLLTNHNTFSTMPYYELLDELKKGTSASTVIQKYKAKVQASVDAVYKK